MAQEEGLDQSTLRHGIWPTDDKSDVCKSSAWVHFMGLPVG